MWGVKKKNAQKPKYNMWQNSWFMIKLAWNAKEKKVLVLCLLSALLAVASNLINLYISPSILSVVERRGTITEFITTILLFVGGLMFVNAASAYVNSNTIFGRISLRQEIISMIFNKNMKTSYPNINDDKFDKLMNKASDATRGNSEASEAIWNTLVALIKNILGFTIYASMLSSIHPFLLLVVIFTSLIGYSISKYLGGYSYRHREENAEHINQLFYTVKRASDYSAAKDIRIFSAQQWLEELYFKTISSYKAFKKKEHDVYIWSKIVDLTLTFLRNGIAYVYLIHLVISGELDVAQFLLYFSAVGGFSTWFSGLLGNLITLHRQSLDISIIREYLEYPEHFKFENGEKLDFNESNLYEIKLENVSFRYPGVEKDTLSNINLTLHPGEKLAVVGLNGAGKTTLVKLICGFLDPTEGRVLLNDVDIRRYNREHYYKMFSAVFQDYSLIAGTIAENVAQLFENIDIQRVMECIDKAGLSEKINSLPDKYNTYLNREVYENGIVLSGGETQRLLLARALYKQAPFIILDEPTAALDPIAESEMYQKYNEMTSEKSSVYISHRLASTRFCDRILFIENAAISEEGTHEELISCGGRYAELFAVQSKYYQEGETNYEK